MVLNNMTRYLKALHLLGGHMHLGTSQYGNSVTLPESFTITNGTSINTFTLYNGQDRTYYYNTIPLTYMTTSSLMTSETSTTTNTYSRLMFGNGTTAVTPDDYKLESPITSGLSLLSMSQNPALTISSEGVSTRTAKYEFQVKNTSSTAITISEVGFYHSLFSSSTNNAPLMVHREVFEPVTIEPSAVGTFVFEFTFVNSIA